MTVLNRDTFASSRGASTSSSKQNGLGFRAKIASTKLMADAAYEILCSREGTGQCLLDEQVMANMGVVDLKQYDMTPGQQSPLDLFIND